MIEEENSEEISKKGHGEKENVEEGDRRNEKYCEGRISKGKRRTRRTSKVIEITAC